MRYFILSDIHSNIEALQSTIHRAKEVGYDIVFCCGDLVGYGPNPVEAIDMIRQLEPVIVRGNHDRVGAGIDDATQFNPVARQAAVWTYSVLPEVYRKYLSGLPAGPLAVNGEAQLVHGAVTHEDNYIFTNADANDNFQLVDKLITFFGHSHFPSIFRAGEEQWTLEADQTADDLYVVKYDRRQKLLVNPGSVGQPRDGDPRASFAIWDQPEQQIEFYRVEYDIETTREKMRRVGLPRYLVDRLIYGR